MALSWRGTVRGFLVIIDFFARIVSRCGRKAKIRPSYFSSRLGDPYSRAQCGQTEESGCDRDVSSHGKSPEADPQCHGRNNGTKIHNLRPDLGPVLVGFKRLFHIGIEEDPHRPLFVSFGGGLSGGHNNRSDPAKNRRNGKSGDQGRLAAQDDANNDWDCGDPASEKRKVIEGNVEVFLRHGFPSISSPGLALSMGCNPTLPDFRTRVCRRLGVFYALRARASAQSQRAGRGSADRRRA